MLAEEPRFTIVAEVVETEAHIGLSGTHYKKSCRHPLPDEKRGLCEV